MRIEDNIRQVQRGLSDVARNQIPFTTSLAINDTLEDVRGNTAKRMRRKLDRPTPFTLRAFRVKRSSKRRLSGSVFAQDRQADYLRWVEQGGERQPKGRAIVVPVGQRVNKYGNMPRRAIDRALARADTFSGAPQGGGPGGIYRRVERGLKLVAYYAASADYDERLDFRRGAERTAEARLPVNFERSLRRALSTARP